jgi:hypothetical protein
MRFESNNLAESKELMLFKNFKIYVLLYTSYDSHACTHTQKKKKKKKRWEFTLHNLFYTYTFSASWLYSKTDQILFYFKSHFLTMNKLV